MSDVEYIIFYVTVPNIELGKKLAYKLVENKIAACANIISNITSIYSWKGKIEEDSELLLILKTTQDKSKELIKYIETHHSYEVPECIGFPITDGSERYLDWIYNSTH